MKQLWISTRVNIFQRIDDFLLATITEINVSTSFYQYLLHIDWNYAIKTTCVLDHIGKLIEHKSLSNLLNIRLGLYLMKGQRTLHGENFSSQYPRLSYVKLKFF